MACPLCRGISANYLEDYRDPILGQTYEIFTCPSCQISFASPLRMVSSEWYLRTRDMEAGALPNDWRYETFFGEGLPKGKLLDVGCGTGQFLLSAKNAGYTVSGFDYNAQAIEQARRLGLDDVYSMDVGQFFAQKQSSYDLVTLWDVLEHVEDPLGLLKDIRGVLRPGGYLCLNVPNGERPIPWPWLREEWDYPPYHFTRWTRQGLSKALEDAGFDLVRMKSSPLPFGFFSSLAYYRILRASFPWLKKVLLRVKTEETGKTWTDLLNPSSASATTDSRKSGRLRRILGDLGTRQALISGGGRIFSVIASPIEFGIVLWFRWKRPWVGKNLFILSKKT